MVDSTGKSSNVQCTAGSANANIVDFEIRFAKLIKGNAFSPRQIFNLNEITLQITEILFKGKPLAHLVKQLLLTIWNNNGKACVKRVVFENWFNHHFCLIVKNGYFKILLILDKAPD